MANIITNCLNENSKPEFIGQIIDIFEDFCSEQDILIDNPDKEDYQDEEDDENNPLAIIFGDDYDTIGDEITGIIDNYNLYSHTISKKERKQIISHIIDTFRYLITKKGYLIMNKDTKPKKDPSSCLLIDIMINQNKKMLSNKIKDTFNNWHLCES